MKKQRLTAAWTAHIRNRCWIGWLRCRFRRPRVLWVLLLEQLAQSRQACAAAGCKKAEVADLDEAIGQHMLQKAVNEGLGGECAQLELTGVRRPVAKGHLVVFKLDQAMVADGYPENIGGQVF